MTDSDPRAAVTAEYLGLADLLAGGPPGIWDQPSLCEEWRVREVVAHVTMPVRYDEATFMAELERCGFDFTRLSNTVAARDGALPTERLVTQLRDDALHQWEPPGGGVHGALNHAVIHSLDVTIPIGAHRVSSDDTIRLVLDGLTAGGGHSAFGIDIAGRRLVAQDLDWSFGGGDELRGQAGALAVALCGRATTTLAGKPLARARQTQPPTG